MTAAMDAPHYVRQPRFLFYIHIAQLVLSLLVLILVAYAMSVLSNILGSFGYNIFCCVYTFIVIAYMQVTAMMFINLWNMWAALILDIFGIIFWISAWGSMASWAAVGNLITSPPDLTGLFGRSPKSHSSSSSSSFGFSDIESSYEKAYARERAGWRCAAAAAGLGALIW